MNAVGDGAETGTGTGGSCPTCGRHLRKGMNFCPGCGNPMNATGPAITTTAGGTLHFHAPAPGPYPYPAMPMPGMYPRPVSPGRAGAVASGVLIIVSAVFVFITGILFLFDGWWWMDFRVIIGILCFFTFALSIVGAIAIFRRMWRFVPVGAYVLLIVCAVVTLLDLWALSLIVLVLAIIGLVLLATSWRQFYEVRDPAYSAYPSFHQPLPMGGGYPQSPAVMAPPMGGPRPMMGAPPPGIGAPPPSMGAPPPPMGAPPPSYVPPEEDEEIIVDVDGVED